MKNLLIVLCIVASSVLKAQQYIDHEQRRIDATDGKLDNFIALRDLDLRNSANYTYFTLIDKLQEAIANNNKIDESKKEFLYREIQKELMKIDENKFLSVLEDQERYEFLFRWVNAYGFEDINKLMENNKDETFMILSFVYSFPELEMFLNDLSINYIDQIFYKYLDFRNADYALSLLEKIVIKAPVTAKKYFINNQPIYIDLSKSTNATIIKLLEINEKYRANSKAFVLIDKIMNNKLTVEQAHELGNDNKKYFKSLLETRAKENPMGEVSVDREISYEALEYVREINLLHEESNEKRFESIKTLSASELYTLMVYGEDEIFTSSFNGVYDELQKKMKTEKITGFQLLKAVGFNKFRMYIKMLSYYGKINSFLSTMAIAERETVLRKFVGGIVDSKNRVLEAVSVADAISAIDDKAILLIFEEEIYKINQLTNLDDDARLIYGLLIKLFNPKVQVHKQFFDSIAELYFTPPIERIEIKRLLGNDGKNVQKHFFYDDEDGEISFISFKASFANNSNWIITEEKQYIKISSTNSKVKIYANKPNFDETAWYYIDKEIADSNEDVEFVIHRGHSYYVEYTVEQIPKSTKLILLGSCGGYNKLTSLLDASDNAQIISTKQIGSMGVNNPLIFKMAEKIRKGEDLVWEEYWNQLKTFFKTTDSLTEERFYDYVAPHQNLGAKFIAAYKTYSWSGSVK